MNKRLFVRDKVAPGDHFELTGSTADFPRVHIFDKRSISAVDSALAAGRPLLIQGEPGIGKSQLAEAVAQVLGRAFRSTTLDAHSDSRDLQWTLDSVQRLADAQLCGMSHSLVTTQEQSGSPPGTEEPTPKSPMVDLSISNYIQPGILWWAFNWNSALTQAGKAKMAKPDKMQTQRAHDNGVVVLIDEIDKANSAVPNGLLEALALRQISPAGQETPVSIAGKAPLIIITTNDFRPLPPAFRRRCFVMTMEYESDTDKLKAWLVERAQKHFPDFDVKLIKSWAGKLLDDRAALANQRNRPGLAEFLDLLRAAKNLARGDQSRHQSLLEEIAPWTLKKHHPK